ncbi:C3 and PZP-like alpha-2-macroglobulin domain-containing protein 8 [Agrilus planipennis]|uniref:C3 and PZP-like alpha-2-macroglobulin domain-containing protein 8 n=1 Tax=Agrilus planipennis TaxID=224129 RepID=A0A7F5R2S6_AGRPL|nr:C3 and PZP-like alpha-2-macroglobulin domain-containing protein 8 [Agrilus planipennis]
MSAPIEVETPDELKYNFLPNISGQFQFRVRAANDAHIALTTEAAETDPMYEVFIGGWGNSKSIIRKNRSKPDVAEVPTPGILNAGEFRGFWVRWRNGTISVGNEGESQPFLSWTDSENIPISYVGICTGWGASGKWIIEESTPNSSTLSSKMCWIPASGGNVPPRAFVGGEDNGEPQYVIRANFQGGIIPGKLISSHGTAYVPWGGEENPVSEYEVLCDFNGTWVPSSEGKVPPNAPAAGETEESEPLFIGRVTHEGTITVGKIQPSHGVCYISYGGQELNFANYEVLVA